MDTPGFEDNAHVGAQRYSCCHRILQRVNAEVLDNSKGLTLSVSEQ